MSSCSQDHPLPALRKLRLHHKDISHQAQDIMLLSSTLNCLSIDCKEQSFIVPSLEAMLSMPQLRELSLLGYFNTPDDVRAACVVLESLSSLEQFTFTATAPVIQEVIPALLGLPEIRRIVVEQDTRLSLSPFPPPHSPSFAEFETANLSSLSSQNIESTFLRNMLSAHNMTNITTLDLTVETHPTERTATSDVFALVARTCPALSTLRLYFKDGAPRLNARALRPVFTLRLCSFWIFHSYPLELRQPDIEAMAKAWGPTVQTLDLNASPKQLVDPLLTMASLVPIAEHCHQLRRLSIYLDALAPAPSISNDDIPKFTPTLKDLDLGLSRIEGPWGIVDFLERLEFCRTYRRGFLRFLNKEEAAIWEARQSLTPTQQDARARMMRAKMGEVVRRRDGLTSVLVS